jgi:hypothetical protein
MCVCPKAVLAKERCLQDKLHNILAIGQLQGLELLARRNQ